jgi:hypothetical protein
MFYSKKLRPRYRASHALIFPDPYQIQHRVKLKNITKWCREETEMNLVEASQKKLHYLSCQVAFARSNVQY